MDSGLSTRMESAIDELVSKASATAPTSQYGSAGVIDLASAQNEVLRPELLEFFKTTVEERLATKVFALPSPNGGDGHLREVLASFFNEYFQPIHTVKSEQIVLTAGASDAIENLIHAICDDGDSVIVPGPYWYGYESILKARANVNIIVAQPPTYQNYDNYLLPSLQAAYDFSANKSRIKAVLMCNPHNPLSRCYIKKSLVECMEFCQERGLHLISDEVFALSWLDTLSPSSPSFVSALSLTEPLVPEGAVKVDPSRVHVVWSASKLFGASGLRVGCLISQQNPQLLRAMSLLTTNHTNNIATLFLTSLLTWSQLPTLLKLNSERLSESYRLLADALKQWNIDFIVPTHGICLFAKLAKRAKTVEDETSFYDRLALRGVRVGPGRFYRGVESEFGWARIRFSVSTHLMNTALAKISTFLAMENT
ncbi:pyridoxal phosphate-dependent transferase [Massariosphaeria phaeospora]|uniref:Pyridoxal phosphate-dependent transferase n=1 Tax=Massariosphaeria phaeospora TaxID=100035 RepID=A0A7C8IFR1_9PLEO|nr:pyridoxal phosphate-dependent transferase [Massariosphaeria phaeospora]